MLYYAQLDNDFVSFLKSLVYNSRINSSPRGQYLAGNIGEQINLNLGADTESRFTTEFYKHAVLAFKQFNKTVEGNIKCSIGVPWINFQRSGEFNPLHNHAGDLSVVVYVDIPECIALENKNSIVETNMPSYGKIDFLYIKEGTEIVTKYSHQPKTGEIFIFPSLLLHTVYPFRSNVERISISFNIFDIEQV